MRAIGIIETRGLAAAFEAADAAVKAAGVKLLGYELSRGAGQITVKLEGDVSAVTAAVEAGAQAAAQVNQVVATLIMGRPHEGIEKLLYSPDMIGLWVKEGTVQEPGMCVDAGALEPSGDLLKEAPPEPEVTCNLCRDPACPRGKGEPHISCIHYGES